VTISSDTLSRLSSAVEVLATAEGSREHRAKVALSFLSEIDGAEFVGDPAEVHWNYIESVAEAIANGTAEKGPGWKVYQCDLAGVQCALSYPGSIGECGPVNAQRRGLGGACLCAGQL
jgi:hypothetical protein